MRSTGRAWTMSRWICFTSSLIIAISAVVAFSFANSLADDFMMVVKLSLVRSVEN